MPNLNFAEQCRKCSSQMQMNVPIVLYGNYFPKRTLIHLQRCLFKNGQKPHFLPDPHFITHSMQEERKI